MNSNPHSRSREDLVRSLRVQGLLKSRSVQEALETIRREDFLWPGEPKALAYLDEPISLGASMQTISAPHMIVIMLEALDLSPGMRVLEVGTGSGYNAALLAHILTQGIVNKGEPLIITIERDKLLAEFAQKNLCRAALAEAVKVVSGDGSLGYPEKSESPLYDRIVVTAAAPYVPKFLLKQLKPGGIILIPVGGMEYQTLTRVRRVVEKNNQSEKFESERLDECVFVPLVGEDAYKD